MNKTRSEIVFIDDALTEIAQVNGHRAMNYADFLDDELLHQKACTNCDCQ